MLESSGMSVTVPPVASGCEGWARVACGKGRGYDDEPDLSSTAAPERSDAAPAATRSRPPGWRNPRLLLGLVLVAASVVLGAPLMATADDTVAGVGARARPARRLHGLGRVTSQSPQRPVPRRRDGRRLPLRRATRCRRAPRLARAVSAGELLPARRPSPAATGRRWSRCPLSVASDDLPATVRQGSHVDVWVTPKVSAVAGRPGPPPPRCSTTWWSSPCRASTDRLAPQTTRQVIVGVPEARATPRSVRPSGATSDGHVVIARHG